MFTHLHVPGQYSMYNSLIHSVEIYSCSQRFSEIVELVFGFSSHAAFLNASFYSFFMVYSMAKNLARACSEIHLPEIPKRPVCTQGFPQCLSPHHSLRLIGHCSVDLCIDSPRGTSCFGGGEHFTSFKTCLGSAAIT